VRCGLPVRQPRATWAATISREIRCNSLSAANRRALREGAQPVPVAQLWSFHGRANGVFHAALTGVACPANTCQEPDLLIHISFQRSWYL